MHIKQCMFCKFSTNQMNIRSHWIYTCIHVCTGETLIARRSGAMYACSKYVRRWWLRQLCFNLRVSFDFSTCILRWMDTLDGQTDKHTHLHKEYWYHQGGIIHATPNCQYYHSYLFYQYNTPLSLLYFFCQSLDSLVETPLNGNVP